MKKILFLFICLNISCEISQKSNIEKDEIAQSLAKVHIIKDSLIFKDSLTSFKIALFDKHYKIINAYYDCDKKAKREFNKEKNSIVDCIKKLVIENDTIKMFATYSKKGNFKFEDLTILVVDDSDKFSFIDTTFSFTVVDGK